MIFETPGDEKTFWKQTEALYKKQKVSGCGLAKRCSNINDIKDAQIVKEFLGGMPVHFF
jgi:hypothetical protein